jgi:hypothetical protein
MEEAARMYVRLLLTAGLSWGRLDLRTHFVQVRSILKSAGV